MFLELVEQQQQYKLRQPKQKAILITYNSSKFSCMVPFICLDIIFVLECLLLIPKNSIYSYYEPPGNYCLRNKSSKLRALKSKLDSNGAEIFFKETGKEAVRSTNRLSTCVLLTSKVNIVKYYGHNSEIWTEWNEVCMKTKVQRVSKQNKKLLRVYCIAKLNLSQIFGKSSNNSQKRFWQDNISYVILCYLASEDCGNIKHGQFYENCMKNISTTPSINFGNSWTDHWMTSWWNVSDFYWTQHMKTLNKIFPQKYLDNH